MTWVWIAFILFGITVLSRPAWFTFAFKVPRTISTLAMKTRFTETLVDIVLTVFTVVTLTT